MFKKTLPLLSAVSIAVSLSVASGVASAQENMSYDVNKPEPKSNNFGGQTSLTLSHYVNIAPSQTPTVITSTMLKPLANLTLSRLKKTLKN